ncbi:hypothetical protein BJV77DRAFT_991714 [Russula vinacea]|nr:hypothetical protein BJV77DRAFT_991714 [Russula vinacea]
MGLIALVHFSKLVQSVPLSVNRMYSLMASQTLHVMSTRMYGCAFRLKGITSWLTSSTGHLIIVNVRVASGRSPTSPHGTGVFMEPPWTEAKNDEGGKEKWS